MKTIKSYCLAVFAGACLFGCASPKQQVFGFWRTTHVETDKGDLPLDWTVEVYFGRDGVCVVSAAQADGTRQAGIGSWKFVGSDQITGILNDGPEKERLTWNFLIRDGRLMFEDENHAKLIFERINKSTGE